MLLAAGGSQLDRCLGGHGIQHEIRDAGEAKTWAEGLSKGGGGLGGRGAVVSHEAIVDLFVT